MPPLAYKVSKIEDTATIGITKFTMTQEMYDPAMDNAELMIGNYYESVVEPKIFKTEEASTVSELEIAYSGKPALRAGGGFKKFILKSLINDNLVDCVEEVKWSIDFPSGDLTKLETSVPLDEFIECSEFRIKCIDDYSLIGKTFTITATTQSSSESIVVEVISL